MAIRDITDDERAHLDLYLVERAQYTEAVANRHPLVDSAIEKIGLTETYRVTGYRFMKADATQMQADDTVNQTRNATARGRG